MSRWGRIMSTLMIMLGIGAIHAGEVFVGGLDVVVRGEAPGGEIDSTTALVQALEASGAEVVEITDLASMVGQPVRLWVCLGTFPNNGTLTDFGGQLIVDVLETGAGVYVEGADVWGFDDPTPLNDYDGVMPVVIDGNDSFLGFVGMDLASGFVGDYSQDAIGWDYTDQLFPTDADAAGPDTAGILQDNGAGGSVNGYFGGLRYETTAPWGNVVVQSVEFGGLFGGNAVQQQELVQVYADFLEPPFIFFERGDVNNDGVVDMADPIATLEILFLEAPAPSCWDTVDVNDDGQLELDDAIQLLSYTFAGASVPTLFPYCTVDGVADGFDPCIYGSCL